MDDGKNEAEWQSWVRQHLPSLLLFARQNARSEADASDLVQEAVVESSRRNGGSTPPPPALVYATIRRRAIDLARREDRRVGRENAALGSTGDVWFDTSVEDRELAELIQGAMRNLPDIYRDVITLKIWGGLTFAEIADTLRIPANTAASRFRYGLAELRKARVFA
jgi:RNA polymerase sigma-70 factor (ECF subfamily)